MTAVLTTELLKLRRSRVTVGTWLALSFGPLVGGLFMVILKDPERARRMGLLGQKAQLTAGAADWPTFLGLLVQMAGVGGMILLAVIVAYLFGREYADRTAKNMLALPVARWRFVVAKLAVAALWFLLLMAWMLVEGLAIGALVGIPGFSRALLAEQTGRVAATAALSLLVMPLAAWVAVVGRGYMLPMGYAIFTMILGTVFGATGWGPYTPWSIVPLYSGAAGPQTALPPASYAVLAATLVVGVVGTCLQLVLADDTQ